MSRIALRLVVAAVGVATMLLGVGTTAVEGDPGRGWDARAVATSYFDQRQNQRGIVPSAASNVATDVTESPGAIHVRVEHYLHGIRVADATSVASMHAGAAQPHFVSGRGLVTQRVNARHASIAATDAATIAEASIGVTQLRYGTTAELVYAEGEGEYRLGWKVIIPALDPLGTWVAHVDAVTGDVVSSANALSFDSGQVFNPNPSQTSGGAVPPPDHCDSALNGTTLAVHETNVTLQGIDDGQNKLKGDHVDLTATGILGAYKAAGQANEASRIYNYNCNDDRFEEVMSYHHIDATQRKLQSLGFNGPYSVMNRAVPVHAHYFGGCNAFFDFFNKGLHFGDGDGTCPPDAGEDADIIVHEYGHAIQDDQVPGFGIPFDPIAAEQARSMGEGFSDFLTAAMFNDSCIGGWGLRGPGVYTTDCLRNADDPFVYPADFEACPNVSGGAEEEHCGGQLWAGVLWDFVQALGGDEAARDLAIRLAVNAHFYVAPTATFAQNAAAIRQSDMDLYAGAHVATINTVFNGRGIVPSPALFDPNVVYLDVVHPFMSDLELRLKVGSTSSPTCQELIWDNNPGSGGIFGYFTSVCLTNPTVGSPWHLEARDTFAGDTGSIQYFSISFGDTVCKPNNTPVFIPDGNIPVYATVTCENTQSAQEFDTDGDLMPDIYEAGRDCMNQFSNDAGLDYDADTLTNFAEFGEGTNPCAADTDGDNCNDNKELGLAGTQNLGGDRDPLSPYDFYDVPVPALSAASPTSPRNKLIGIPDILAIIAYSGAVEGGPPNAGGYDYDSDFNGNGIPDGEEYDRTPSVDSLKLWQSGAPNNNVSLQDALVSIAQSGHNCG